MALRSLLKLLTVTMLLHRSLFKAGVANRRLGDHGRYPALIAWHVVNLRCLVNFHRETMILSMSEPNQIFEQPLMLPEKCRT